MDPAKPLDRNYSPDVGDEVVMTVVGPQPKTHTPDWMAGQEGVVRSVTPNTFEVAWEDGTTARHAKLTSYPLSPSDGLPLLQKEVPAFARRKEARGC